MPSPDKKWKATVAHDDNDTVDSDSASGLGVPAANASRSAISLFPPPPSHLPPLMATDTQYYPSTIVDDDICLGELKKTSQPRSPTAPSRSHSHSHSPTSSSPYREYHHHHYPHTFPLEKPQDSRGSNTGVQQQPHQPSPISSYPPAHLSSTTVMSWVSVGSDRFDDGATIRSVGGSSIATGWHLASAPPSSTACAGPSSIAPTSAFATLRAKRRAGLAVAGAFVALFCTFGLMNSFGTFHAHYSRNQMESLSPGKISWIGSLQLWIFFFSGGFIGRTFDSFGPTGLMLAGSLFYALSMVATAFSTQYFHYMLSQGLFFGLSVGLLFYPSLASVSTHFTKYRATALGIVAAGASVGGVVYPIILQKLFASHGFRTGVLVSGLASAVACVISAVTVTTAPRLPAALILSMNSKGGQVKPPKRKLFDRKSITDTKFALLVVGSCFVALGLFTPFFYIVNFAHKLASLHSGSKLNAAYVLAILNAGGILGRVAPAYLSDSLGHYNLLFPAAFLSGLSCVSLWLGAAVALAKGTEAVAGVVGVLLAFAAVYGFLSGAFVSLITPCVVQISEGREIGTRIGMLYTIISVPSLVGGPITGALLTYQHGVYTGMIVFSGITVMVGSFFIFAAKLAIDRRILARV